jgi:hypothetical protein
MNRILAAAFIVIGVGLFFLYVNPTYTTKIAQKKQYIASYQKALDASDDFLKKKSNLETQMKSISPTNLQRLQAFLPDDVDNIQLILDLNALAARSGLTLSNFSIQSDAAASTEAAPAAGPGATPAGPSLSSSSLVDSARVSVNATGSYTAFRAFLAAAEQSLRPMDVTSMQVTGGGTDAGASAIGYTYQITFRLYWLH